MKNTIEDVNFYLPDENFEYETIILDDLSTDDPDGLELEIKSDSIFVKVKQTSGMNLWYDSQVGCTFRLQLQNSTRYRVYTQGDASDWIYKAHADLVSF